MAKRKRPEAGPPAVKEDVPPARVPTAVWVNGELVCVEITDPPPTHEGAGVCRCPACHGAVYQDLAAVPDPKR